MHWTTKVFFGFLLTSCGILLAYVAVLSWHGADTRSKTYPPSVQSVPVSEIALRASDGKGWKAVKTTEVLMRTPLVENDEETVGQLRSYEDGSRLLIVMGGDEALSYEELLIYPPKYVKDGSYPDNHDVFSTLKDIYSFDSEQSVFQGDYRNFLHHRSVFFRRKRVDKVEFATLPQDNLRAVIYHADNLNGARRVSCEVFSADGIALAVFVFESRQDDVQWILESCSTLERAVD